MRTNTLTLTTEAATVLDALDAARVHCNSVEAHASERDGTYGLVKDALMHALTVEFGADDAAEIYSYLLDAGEGVEDAVNRINGKRMAYASELDAIERSDAADHRAWSLDVLDALTTAGPYTGPIEGTPPAALTPGEVERERLARLGDDDALIPACTPIALADLPAARLMTGDDAPAVTGPALARIADQIDAVWTEWADEDVIQLAEKARDAVAALAKRLTR